MSSSNQIFRRVFLGAIAVAVVALSGCQGGVSQRPVAGKLSDSQTAELRRLGFTEAAEGWTLNISDSKLLFDFADDTLSASGVAVIDNIARGLVKVGLTRIRAEGHSDSVGSQEFNEALSLRRAENVARQLVMGGFLDSNVFRTGFGKTKPVADNTSAEGRAQNRRVTLIVLVE